ncbi:MAG TPA: hypothetical protein VNZ64_19790 [Candidatus Acidoferrum sp.]|jgi:hypothetical protein|nr:hypothetical protein [Candidatus Acidoferrum sp.]
MKRLLMFAAVGLLVIGCASPNVNPPQARANTGYVDFHTEAAAQLMWEVARFDSRTESFQRVFSKFEPLQDRVLRLAFAPGRHRFRVTFLNRVIAQPAEVEVEVQNGKITPVGITFTEASTTLVQTKEVSRGGTLYGRSGRSTKIGTVETAMAAISALADAPVAYQVKERMPYAR